MHWPGSARWSDMAIDFGPDPKRSFPGSGGIMKFPDLLGTIETEPGISHRSPVQCLYGRRSRTWLPGLWHAMFTNSDLDWFRATTIFPLVRTRRHDLMYYAGATPVCLVARGFGAEGVVRGG